MARHRRGGRGGRRSEPEAPPKALPERVTGQVHVFNGVPYLVADSDEIDDDLPILRDGESLACSDGDVVVATLVPPPTNARYALPFARVESVLGAAGTAEGEVGRIVASRGLPGDYPEVAVAEAEAFPEGLDDDEIAEREDLRGVPLVTIDGATARDFDDAIAVEHTKRGWRLTVAIADVAHYVSEGSALDAEALARATSVYLPGRWIPMLPMRLSGDLCSLRPGVDRPAMAVVLELGPDGGTESARFFNAVIRSRDRLTYTEVQASLDGDEGGAGPAWAHRERLAELRKVAETLFQRRVARGAIDLELPEPEVILRDGTVEVESVRARARQWAHRLVEECMLAANEAVGAWFEEQEHPAIYRVHPPPHPEKLAALARVAAAFGHPIPTGKDGSFSPRALSEFLDEVADSPTGPSLHHMALRTLARAEYAVEDVGHFGLGATGYLHFTSPIRRYPDLAVHRLLKRVLGGRRRGDAGALAAELDEQAAHCSAMERRAMEAEFEALDLYRCLAVRDRVGEEFDGVIATVAPFGLFVRLEAPFVEGMVHVSDLGDDWFDFDGDRMMMIGRRTGRTLRLGDTMRVRIAQVDVARRRIALVLATPAP